MFFLVVNKKAAVSLRNVSSIFCSIFFHLGTKENDIIDVLTKAPTEKRQAIAAAYKVLYKTVRKCSKSSRI